MNPVHSCPRIRLPIGWCELLVSNAITYYLDSASVCVRVCVCVVVCVTLHMNVIFLAFHHKCKAAS